MEANTDEEKPSAASTSGSRKPRGRLDSTGDVVGVQVEPFPFRLFRMLEEAPRRGFEAIISWVDSGKAFKVHNRKAFRERVLPHYFQGIQYKSFQRQINLYHFERQRDGRLKGAYSHPLFQRNNPKAFELMTAKKMDDGRAGLGDLGDSSTPPGQTAHALSQRMSLQQGQPSFLSGQPPASGLSSFLSNAPNVNPPYRARRREQEVANYVQDASNQDHDRLSRTSQGHFDASSLGYEYGHQRVPNEWRQLSSLEEQQGPQISSRFNLSQMDAPANLNLGDSSSISLPFPIPQVRPSLREEDRNFTPASSAYASRPSPELSVSPPRRQPEQPIQGFVRTSLGDILPELSHHSSGITVVGSGNDVDPEDIVAEIIKTFKSRE